MAGEESRGEQREREVLLCGPCHVDVRGIPMGVGPADERASERTTTTTAVTSAPTTTAAGMTTTTTTLPSASTAAEDKRGGEGTRGAREDAPLSIHGAGGGSPTTVTGSVPDERLCALTRHGSTECASDAGALSNRHPTAEVVAVPVGSTGGPRAPPPSAAGCEEVDASADADRRGSPGPGSVERVSAICGDALPSAAAVSGGSAAAGADDFRPGPSNQAGPGFGAAAVAEADRGTGRRSAAAVADEGQPMLACTGGVSDRCHGCLAALGSATMDSGEQTSRLWEPVGREECRLHSRPGTTAAAAAASAPVAGASVAADICRGSEDDQGHEDAASPLLVSLVREEEEAWCTQGRMRDGSPSPAESARAHLRGEDSAAMGAGTNGAEAATPSTSAPTTAPPHPDAAATAAAAAATAATAAAADAQVAADTCQMQRLLLSRASSISELDSEDNDEDCEDGDGLSSAPTSTGTTPAHPLRPGSNGGTSGEGGEGEKGPASSRGNSVPGLRTGDHRAPLSVVIQGPAGSLFVGTESVGGRAGSGRLAGGPHLGKPEDRGANERRGGRSVSAQESGEDHTSTRRTPVGDADAQLEFLFAPAADDERRIGAGEAQDGNLQVTAIHITLPPPSQQQQQEAVLGGSVDLRGMEALFDTDHVAVFRRRKRAYISLLVLGSLFYIAAFIAGAIHFKDGQPDASSTTPSSASVDYVTRSMLTSTNIWVAMAYLVLYLSLDMIGLAGCLLENASLLTLYVVVELTITIISAIDQLRPFLLYRLLVIFLAYQVRYGCLEILEAERRLYARLSGLTVSPPNTRTWLARLGIFPGTAADMWQHGSFVRLRITSTAWYAEFMRQQSGRTARPHQQRQQQQQGSADEGDRNQLP